MCVCAHAACANIGLPVRGSSEQARKFEDASAPRRSCVDVREMALQSSASVNCCVFTLPVVGRFVG